MADKDVKLSITLRAVDEASAKIQAINAKLAASAKPYKDLGKALGEFKKNSGLDAVERGLNSIVGGVKDAIGGVLKLGGALGGLAAGATVELVHLVDQFDDLGKKAKLFGVSADFLAQMRDAAERTGVPIEALDEGLQAFTENLGQARAGTGRMAKFVGLVSPALLKQLKAAKGNAEAFDLLADAMKKLPDPAKRAALAQKTLGDARLAPLLMQGSKAIAEMRDHYAELAGPQEDAVKASEEAHEAMIDLKDSTDGVKAALVVGLAPALKVISERLAKWLAGHREDIKEWAIDLGKKIPGAFQTIVGWVGTAIDKLEAFYSKLQTVVDAVKYLAGQGAPGDADVKNAEQIFLDQANAGGAGDEKNAIAHARKVALARNEDDLISISSQDFLDAKRFGGFDKYQEAARRYLANVDKFNGEDSFKHLHGSELGSVDAERRFRDAGGPFTGAPVFNTGAILDALRAPDTITPGSISDAIGGLQRLAQGAGPQQQAKIKIEITGAPRGTRASTDPSSTADVDLNVGYQLFGAP